MGSPTAMRPFDHDEIPKMMATFDNKWEYRNKSLVALGVCTGFRISELLELRVDDVYYFGEIKDTIRLPARLLKGNQPRHPKKIFPEAKYYLLKWVDQLKIEFDATRRSFLFLSAKSPKIRKESTYHILRKAAKDAGLKLDGVGNHSMRKTFANAVYDYWDKEARAGRRIEPMRMVQLELGHSTIEDTYRYMQFKLEEKPDGVFADYGLLSTETELMNTTVDRNGRAVEQPVDPEEKPLADNYMDEKILSIPG